MDQLYGICRVSVAPVRSAPSDRAEISSQLLFGEQAEILNKEDRWWYIRIAYDNYEGWIDFKQLALVSKDEYDAHQCTALVPASPLNVLVDAHGEKYYLSPASNLPFFQDGYCRIGEDRYAVSFSPAQYAFSDVTKLIESALFFKNTPYLWGGKTLFGIDCSGFVQTVFRLNGIALQRDASKQAEQGRTVDFLPEVLPGDVAFFDNEEGRVIHVGIMLNTSEIIHASGKVKVDPIDDQGIFSQELGRYTHKLRIIKRFI